MYGMSKEGAGAEVLPADCQQRRTLDDGGGDGRGAAGGGGA